MGCVPRLDLAIFLALATERLSQARIVFVMMVVVVGGDGGVGWGGYREEGAQYGRPLQSCVTFYNKPFVSVCASISRLSALTC